MFLLDLTVKKGGLLEYNSWLHIISTQVKIKAKLNQFFIEHA